MAALKTLALVLASLLAVPSGATAGASAADLYHQARVAERKGRHIEALLFYSRARALEPSNPTYARAARRVRAGAARALALAGQHRSALELSADSLLGRAGLQASPTQSLTRDFDAPQAAPRPYRSPPKLQYRKHQTAFRFRGSVRDAYVEAASAFGVRVRFDGDFDADGPVRANLSECDFPCAMYVLGSLSGSVAVPLARDLILVIADDSNTRSALEPVGVASIPLRGLATPQAQTEVTQMLQQVLDLRSLQSVGTSGIVLMRAAPGKLEMARTLVQDLGHPAADVEIEVALLSAGSGRDTRAGMGLPTNFPLANLSTVLGARPDVSGAAGMIGIGGGKTQLGISFGNSSVLATLERDTAQMLQSMRLRTAHGLPAEFKIGERYPIASAQFLGGVSAPTGPNYIQPPPTITFEDLGLNLAVTPHVHTALAVTLELEVEVRLLAGSAVNGVPVLANRTVQSRLRLRQGEFAILSGLSVFERRLTRSGPAGLAQIPLLGVLFRRNHWSWNRRDMLVLVTPRVVRLPPGELARAPTMLYGTEERALVQY